LCCAELNRCEQDHQFYIRTCIYTCIHIYMYVYIYTRIYAMCSKASGLVLHRVESRNTALLTQARSSILHTYMHIYMYTYTYIYLYIYIYIRMHALLRRASGLVLRGVESRTTTLSYTQKRVCTHKCANMHTHKNVRTRLSILHTCTYIYMHMYMFTYIYIYIYIYTHEYIVQKDKWAGAVRSGTKANRPSDASKIINLQKYSLVRTS